MFSAIYYCEALVRRLGLVGSRFLALKLNGWMRSRHAFPFKDHPIAWGWVFNNQLKAMFSGPTNGHLLTPVLFSGTLVSHICCRQGSLFIKHIWRVPRTADGLSWNGFANVWYQFCSKELQKKQFQKRQGFLLGKLGSLEHVQLCARVTPGKKLACDMISCRLKLGQPDQPRWHLVEAAGLPFCHGQIGRTGKVSSICASGAMNMWHRLRAHKAQRFENMGPNNGATRVTTNSAVE